MAYVVLVNSKKEKKISSDELKDILCVKENNHQGIFDAYDIVAKVRLYLTVVLRKIITWNIHKLSYTTSSIRNTIIEVREQKTINLK